MYIRQFVMPVLNIVRIGTLIILIQRNLSGK